MDAAVQDFQGGVTSFQRQLDALVAGVSAERAALQEAQTQLASERSAYDEEKQRVSQVHVLLYRHLLCSLII